MSAQRGWGDRGGLPGRLAFARILALVGVVVVGIAPARSGAEIFNAGILTDGVPARPGFAQIEARAFEGEAEFRLVTMDPATGSLYVVTEGDPPGLLKFRGGAGATLPPLVRRGRLGLGDGPVSGAAIDSAGGRAFFCTASVPARIIKVALGDGDSTPTRSSALTLPASSAAANSILFNPASGHLFVGMENSQVAKIAAGAGDSTPTLVSMLTLPEAASVREGGIDSERDTAVFAIAYPAGSGRDSGAAGREVFQPPYTYAPPPATPVPVNSGLLKIGLGDGDSSPTRAGVVAFQGTLRSVLVDPQAHKAHVLARAFEGYFFWYQFNFYDPIYSLTRSAVALGAGDAPPGAPEVTYTGQALLHNAYHSAFDPVMREIYMHDTRLLSNSMSLVESLSRQNVDTGEAAASVIPPNYGGTGSVLDPRTGTFFTIEGHGLRGYACRPSRLLSGSQVLLDRDGYLTGVGFKSHAAGGNLRFALYQEQSTGRRLVWESGPVVNNGGAIFVPFVSSPRLPYLSLTSSTPYWLAWQSDTDAVVGLSAEPADGKGFCEPHEFGPMPQNLQLANPLISTRWTGYIAYGTANPTPTASPTASPVLSPLPTETLYTPTPEPTEFPTASPSVSPSTSPSLTASPLPPETRHDVVFNVLHPDAAGEHIDRNGDSLLDCADLLLLLSENK